MPALYAAPVLATRPKFYDLLVHKPDKSLAILSADVGERPAPFAGTYDQVYDAQGSTVQVKNATETKQLDLQLHLKDLLPKTCIETLSSVLPAEIFLPIYDALLRLLCKYPQRTASHGEMALLSALLLQISGATNDSSSAQQTPWEKLQAARSANNPDFVFPTPLPTFSPNRVRIDETIEAPSFASSSEILQAILLSLHLIYEDCQLQPARWADADVLRPLLIDRKSVV